MLLHQGQRPLRVIDNRSFIGHVGLVKNNPIPFDLNKLIQDVFAPQPDERVLVMVDIPHRDLADNPDWQDRRVMAEEWRAAFETFPVVVHPLLSFPATGAGNADLPAEGRMNNQPVSIAQVMAGSHIVVAMTEFSATAPLAALARNHKTLRVASMPGVLRRMEQSALSADYREVARKTYILNERLTRAETARITFSTGHVMDFDLRHRRGHADDGLCHRGRKFPVINLPSGEAFIVPYEGERKGEPSRTGGRIPMIVKGEPFVLSIEANRIVEVLGDGPAAAEMRSFLDTDAARRNVAELGLGCNDRAVARGNVLEDEKVGMHWAYGRSEHLGGTVGPDAFQRPEHVVHQDVVYAPGLEVTVSSIRLTYPASGEEEIMRDGAYVIL